jgi:glycosyltransferase involved in cell wall biosynthesis
VPRVSVIVPAKDAAATLGAALVALERQDLGEPFEVIVVDDGSTDGTAAVARAAPVVTAVLESGGAGPGAARNLGATAATGDVLAFTDADCAPEPGWLRAGLAAMEDADLVQGRVVVDPAARMGPFDRFVAVGGLSHLFETANLFLRRADFAAAGGFEAWLSPRRSKELAEDVWLGWRLARAGARVAFCADAVVRHAVFPRRAGDYVAERVRVRFFPEMVGRVPELRQAFCHRRFFLTRRSAAFDLAAAGAALALVGRRHPVALLGGALAAAPYARLAIADARRWGRRRAPAVALVAAGADAVGLGALAVGSARARTVLL